jgi:ATP-dependent RNA helicase DeaD
VIHVNMPDEMEFYTHRSGRTARAGKKGISIALVSRNEMGRLKQIEKTMKAPVRKMHIPTGAEVCQKQLLGFMHKVREVKVNDAEISEFLPAVYEELNDLTKQDLIKRFASIEFNRFLDYYRNAPDLNTDGARRGESEGRGYGGTRFFINLGKMDNIDKAKMLEVIDEFTGLEKKDIGQIDLKGAYSFFEVDKNLIDKVVKGFVGAEYQGRQVRVEVTDAKSSGKSKSSDRDDHSSPRESEGNRRPDSRDGDRNRGIRKSDGGGSRAFEKKSSYSHKKFSDNKKNERFRRRK